MGHDPEEEAFFEHARREMFPKMAESAIAVTLVSGEPDPKLCIELGAALLFDKPIILVGIGGKFPIPRRLEELADAVVYIGEDESLREGPGAERLFAEIQRLLPKPKGKAAGGG